jgi:hypothetical protein
MPTTFNLQKGIDRAAAIGRIAAFLTALSRSHAWTVEVKQFNRRRSLSQNALLWSIYGQILTKGGEQMGGWSKEDLHQFFLIDHFGAERRELFGRARLVPHSRSSNLDKQAFADFVEHIARFMAERGVYIEMPDDVREVA